MSDIVPRSSLTRTGVKGVSALAGGVGLLILNALHPLAAIIVGGVLTVGGLAFTTGTKKDKTAGIVTMGAGILTGLAGLIPGLHFLLFLPGIGLLGAGIYSLVKFLRGMKTRT